MFAELASINNNYFHCISDLFTNAKPKTEGFQQRTTGMHNTATVSGLTPLAIFTHKLASLVPLCLPFWVFTLHGNLTGATQSADSNI